jgi:hypothetical protein
MSVYIEHGNFTDPLPNEFNQIVAIVTNYNMYLYNKNRVLKNPNITVIHGSSNALKYVLYNQDEATVCLRDSGDLAKDLKVVSEATGDFKILVPNTKANTEITKEFLSFFTVSKIDSDYVYLIQKSSVSESS